MSEWERASERVGVVGVYVKFCDESLGLLVSVCIKLCDECSGLLTQQHAQILGYPKPIAFQPSLCTSNHLFYQYPSCLERMTINSRSAQSTLNAAEVKSAA